MPHLFKMSLIYIKPVSCIVLYWPKLSWILLYCPRWLSFLDSNPSHVSWTLPKAT